MYKVIAFAFIASVLHLEAATAKENTTPPVNGPGRVSCRCTCTSAGGTAGAKVWSWNGTRSGCQGYDGGQCKLVFKKNTLDGTLSNCDVIVIKTKGKDSTNRKPDGGLSR